MPIDIDLLRVDKGKLDLLVYIIIEGGDPEKVRAS
jgi:hypothetical protein